MFHSKAILIAGVIARSTQSSVRILTSVVLLSTACLCGLVSCQAERQPPSSVSRIVQPRSESAPSDFVVDRQRDDEADETAAAVSNAEAPLPLAEAYQALLSDCNSDQLDSYVARSDMGISLTAGWERVRRTVPQSDIEASVIKPDPLALARFFGLVEGHTHVPLPKSWEDRVRGVRSNGRRKMFFPDLDEQEIQVGTATEPTPELKTDGANSTVTYQSEQWSIPFENIGADCIAVTVSQNCAYVAPYSSAPRPYSLFAIDRASKKILWNAKVWSQGGFGGFSGRHYQEVLMQIREHDILVLGISDPAVYIEAFDLKTGKNLWRFGSSYLEYKIK